ncbi:MULTISPECIES: DUF1192 domain-containing protein [Rhizobium]|uniref:DUF1192 domain-containing protein n=1 Tax=Rhizobium wuzhouense TaxID=1986026 RepID=A0ABX5NRB6_9HYPH|nr:MULTISPECIES: DUF1192 domain-containing protein [Rhizobium]PYB73116.1 DUF1192 domain-containing protein [Rhizobium wuzhouense]RKE83805.1 uncharacterized small protein (DUF1192 family) [Rhizobium sp. AG855]
MIAEEEPRKPATVHQIGCDLSAISADELHHRIAQLEDEIGRIRAEIIRKDASRKAADSLFGPKV